VTLQPNGSIGWHDDTISDPGQMGLDACVDGGGLHFPANRGPPAGQPDHSGLHALALDGLKILATNLNHLAKVLTTGIQRGPPLSPPHESLKPMRGFSNL